MKMMTRRSSWCLQQFRRITTSQPTVFEVVNPASGRAIAEVPDDSAQDVAEKFERLAAGQKMWDAVPVYERREALERFNELLRQNMNNLSQILTSEMGKPIKQSKNEIRATVDRIKFYVNNYEKVLQERTVLETTRLMEKVVYEPLGVIANISAWNYPYFVSANVFAAALLTGNAVLYKPSEYASLSGLEITRLLHKAGVPADAFQVTTGKAGTGAAVASLESLGGVFFTGSFKTGLQIAKQAASNLVKVQLELGGKDAVYVRQDVPNVASAAASIADGAFYNNGQSCCSVERIYVDRRIFPEFVGNFIKTVKSFKVGDPLDEETYIGPLARQPQVPFLASQVTDALDKGANAVVGGNLDFTEPSNGGFWFPPTGSRLEILTCVPLDPEIVDQVLIDVNHTMNVMREESFGPLIGIQSGIGTHCKQGPNAHYNEQAVDGDEEASQLMKDTAYGLTASVFCKSSTDAEAILRGLEVGTGYWNCCDRVSPRLPWSGRKASGLGSTLGLDGLRSFVRPKGLFFQTP